MTASFIPTRLSTFILLLFELTEVSFRDARQDPVVTICKLEPEVTVSRTLFSLVTVLFLPLALTVVRASEKYTGAYNSAR